MKKLMIMLMVAGMLMVQGCDDYEVPEQRMKEQRIRAAEIAAARSRPTEKDRTLDAYCMAQQFIEARLKSPRSAKWTWGGHSDRTINLGSGRYRYAYYVDSQNGFGAMIRTRFVCVVKWVGGTQWRLESLNFLE